MRMGNDCIERRVLLITSQEEVLAPMVAVIRTILQQMPAMVAPQKALPVIQSQNADLIIIDMQDCKEPLPLIRECKERFVTIPVIAMVPYGNVNIVEQVLEHGADDYISQPIALERLKTTLRNALRLRTLLSGDGNVHHFEHFASRSAQYAQMLTDKDGRIRPLREIEDAVIEHTIGSCGGCITQAARVLGVGRSTLYRKLQEKIQERAQSSRENHATRPMMVVSSIGDS